MVGFQLLGFRSGGLEVSKRLNLRHLESKGQALGFRMDTLVLKLSVSKKHAYKLGMTFRV